MAVKHNKTATKADDPDAEINKVEWNADHTIEDNTITDAMITTHASTKITGLAVQTQALDMGSKDITAISKAVITDALPRFILEESDQASNTKKWGIESNGSVFSIFTTNDAESTQIKAIQINRDSGSNEIAKIRLKTAGGVSRLTIEDTVVTLGSGVNIDFAGNNIINTGTLTLPTSTDTLIGKATTDILTNKSYDLGGTGNVLTGTKAQFDTALSDDNFAYLATTNTFTSTQTFNEDIEFDSDGGVNLDPFFTFTGIKSSGASSVFSIITVNTTRSETTDNGFDIKTGALAVPATNKLILDGLISTADTSIRESSANLMTFEMGGSDDITFGGGIGSALSDSGTIRLPNTALLGWRNSEDNANITLGVDSSERLVLTLEDAHTNQGFEISNGDGSLIIVQGGPTAGRFLPQMIGSVGTNNNDHFVIQSQCPPANDVGDRPLISMDGRQNDNTTLVNRPMIGFRNNGVFKLQFDNNGSIGMLATQKLFLDGIQATGHTYITEVSADYFRVVVGNAIGLGLQEGATDATEVNVIPGALNTLANDATDGFLYIPETATGAPTGTPTAYTGKAAMCFDPANKNLYVYNTDASAWESVTLA